MSLLKTIIAVTGIGAVSPLGPRSENLAEGLRQLRCPLKPLSIFETDIRPHPIVGEVQSSLSVGRKFGFRLSRTDRMAILAAREACENHKYPDGDPLETGIVIGTTVGGLGQVDPEFAVDPQSCRRQKGQDHRRAAIRRAAPPNEIR